jgi:hypothetical protein
VIAIGICPAWIDGGALWLLAQHGNGEIYIKYDILHTVPKRSDRRLRRREQVSGMPQTIDSDNF